MVHSLLLPLDSRMGCAPIFAIVIAIPIHPKEKNRNRNRNRVINFRCEWTLSVKTMQPHFRSRNSRCEWPVGKCLRFALINLC